MNRISSITIRYEDGDYKHYDFTPHTDPRHVEVGCKDGTRFTDGEMSFENVIKHIRAEVDMLAERGKK